MSKQLNVDDRWTIRGVSPEIRTAVKAEVAQRGETVGEFVERALINELQKHFREFREHVDATNLETASVPYARDDTVSENTFSSWSAYRHVSEVLQEIDSRLRKLEGASQDKPENTDPQDNQVRQVSSWDENYEIKPESKPMDLAAETAALVAEHWLEYLEACKKFGVIPFKAPDADMLRAKYQEFIDGAITARDLQAVFLEPEQEELSAEQEQQVKEIWSWLLKPDSNIEDFDIAPEKYSHAANEKK